MTKVFNAGTNQKTYFLFVYSNLFQITNTTIVGCQGLVKYAGNP